MSAQEGFGDLLASKLAWAPGPAPGLACGTIRTLPFEPRMSVLERWELLATPSALASARTPEALGPRRPLAGSRLTATQQSALQLMRRLGAHLDDRFDPIQLRTAYRVLALTHHPDRHPSADDQQRGILAARFSALTDAYQALLPAAE